MTTTNQPHRLNPHSTPDQDAASQRHATEATLDQRLFIASPQQAQALIELLDQAPTDNAGLGSLFNHSAPWEAV